MVMSRNSNVYGAEGLSARAVEVYLYLQDRANKEGTCYPSIKTIARDTKLSVSTVKRGIADLVAHGDIKTEQRWRENGGRSSKLYILPPRDSPAQN